LLDSKTTIIKQPKKASELYMDDRSVFFAKVKWELCFLYIEFLPFFKCGKDLKDRVDYPAN